MHKILQIKSAAIYLISFLLFSLLPFSSKALTKDFYASNSALSQGNWAKISVQETGMQFISYTTLKNLGFSNPTQVNVYGFGGRMLSEKLNEEMEDDLPLIPSLHTDKGIIFFGHSTEKWEKSNDRQMIYSHVNNAYSDNAYYFISDSNPDQIEPQIETTLEASPSQTIVSYTERLVHEQDLLAPSNTGRLMLGEDFRVKNNQFFTFDLPDNMGDAIAKINFGAKSSSGQASLMFTANGVQLPSTASDNIAAASSTKFIVTTTTVKEINNPGEKLNLGITFSNTGALSTAALDFIEIEYERALKLRDSELYFYIEPETISKVEIGNCDESTVVWNITNPLNPEKVATSVSGGILKFNAPKGYREYIAFNPVAVKRTVKGAGKINNQNIHGMQSPDMVIISPDIYRSAAQKIADLHKETDGFNAIVLSPEEIYNEFSSGNPDVTAFRRMFKMWYDRAEGVQGLYPGYCLIMSRPTYDNKMVTSVVRNAGYPRVPIWQSPTGDTESNSYSTDDYIGMLSDNFSDLNIGTATIHVAVGRMPVKNLNEANIAVSKLEKYMKNPALGGWRNQVMVIADDQDNGVHLAQAEDCISNMRSSGNGSSFIYEKLYLDSYKLEYTATGASYPEAKQRMLNKWNEGVMLINYIGHANPNSWGHEGLLTWTDINSMSNANLPFIYAATCEFLRWDDDNISGAEELWLNPNAGVIGMISPSRSVLISANGILNKSTSSHFFKRDSFGKGMRVGKIMVDGKNGAQTDNNKLRYGLIGDPAMRLPSPELNVEVETFAGEKVSDTSDMPQISARSTVKIEGVVTDTQGSKVSDFNGTVEILLYDAEKVITTNGNGTDGVESIYNDRKTRLYSGRAKVEGGNWSTVVSMPSEIENNYSPALLSLYAYDDNGREANGGFEKFYVYGFDSNAEDDFEGPEISEFYLNNPTFSNGDLVSRNPMLVVSVFDPSGINMSEAGLGHSMVVSIDEKIFFNDVSLFYEPDLMDPRGGKISYPLSNIEPGEHTLKFIVWDNANNSSEALLTFNISASWLPEIGTLTTDVNPATTSVNFIVAADGISSSSCTIEVFDLSGRKIWSATNPANRGSNDKVTLQWDLCNMAGSRVPRGIYLYKATLTTSEGAIITKSKKLAVTAP